jgi:hypothetical protein
VTDMLFLSFKKMESNRRKSDRPSLILLLTRCISLSSIDNYSRLLHSHLILFLSEDLILVMVEIEIVFVVKLIFDENRLNIFSILVVRKSRLNDEKNKDRTNETNRENKKQGSRHFLHCSLMPMHSP